MSKSTLTMVGKPLSSIVRSHTASKFGILNNAPFPGCVSGKELSCDTFVSACLHKTAVTFQT